MHCNRKHFTTDTCQSHVQAFQAAKSLEATGEKPREAVVADSDIHNYGLFERGRVSIAQAPLKSIVGQISAKVKHAMNTADTS